jgi:hypothetical protein
MPNTYRAEFFTGADYVIRKFEAETPEAALRMARALQPDDLFVESYHKGQPVDEITIRDSEGEDVATWYDDDARLRLACDLLAGLEKTIHYAEGEGFTLEQLIDRPGSKTEVTKARQAVEQARVTIAKAKGGRQ